MLTDTELVTPVVLTVELVCQVVRIRDLTPRLAKAYATRTAKTLQRALSALEYAIVTPWKPVKPLEMRLMKLRLNNVGVGRRREFGIEVGRLYSRMMWLSGEVQILSGLDESINISREDFMNSPEFRHRGEWASGSVFCSQRSWAREAGSDRQTDLCPLMHGRALVVPRSEWEFLAHRCSHKLRHRTQPYP